MTSLAVSLSLFILMMAHDPPRDLEMSEIHLSIGNNCQIELSVEGFSDNSIVSLSKRDNKRKGK